MKQSSSPAALLFFATLVLPLWLSWAADMPSSESNHQRIIKWWLEEASVRKPLKCAMNPGLKDEIPEELANKYLREEQRQIFLRGRPCGQNETAATNYVFKGQIKEGRFEGPGKLKIDPVEAKDEAFYKEQNVCLSTRVRHKGHKIIEAVGTFENGTLTGPAKITFSDKSMVIADFKKGAIDGLRRGFMANGDLEVYSYMKSTCQQGPLWNRVGNYVFVVLDGSFYNGWDYAKDRFNCIFIPLNTSEPVFVGSYNPILSYADNLHQAELEDVNFEFCFPQMKWRVLQATDKVLNSNGTDLVVMPKEEGQNCKVGQTEATKTPEDKFVNWFMNITVKVQTSDSLIMNLLRIKKDSEPVDHLKVRQPFIANLTLLEGAVEGIAPLNMSIWNGPVTTWDAHQIKLNHNMELHGTHDLRIRTEFLNNTGFHEFLDWSPRQIIGTFVNGKLQGLGVIVTWRGQHLVTFFEEGVLHGPGLLTGQVPVMDMEKRGFKIRGQLDSLHPHHGIGFIGKFKNGQVVGNFWIGLINNGFLHGTADESGHVTGDNIAYIYPDGETAFKGRFEDRIMKKAYNVDVLEYGCDENYLMKVEKFSQPLSDQVFFYEPCTNETFGGGAPLWVRDPYEVKTVKLAPSSIPNSGEGVFLIRDMPKYRFASLYSMFLYRWPDQDQIYKETCMDNIAKSDEYRRHCKKYSLGISYYGGTIDVPPELDVNPLPNLGPKVNHNFRQNNSVYSETEHPRYGLIQTVTPVRDLKAGDELFTYYGYGPNEFPADFLWYHEAKLKIEREERIQKLEAERKERLERTDEEQKPKSTKKTKNTEPKPKRQKSVKKKAVV